MVVGVKSQVVVVVRSRLVEVIVVVNGRMATGMATSPTCPTRIDQLLGQSRTTRISSYAKAAVRKDTPVSSARIGKLKARLRRFDGRMRSRINGWRTRKYKPGWLMLMLLACEIRVGTTSASRYHGDNLGGC